MKLKCADLYLRPALVIPPHPSPLPQGEGIGRALLIRLNPKRNLHTVPSPRGEG